MKMDVVTEITTTRANEMIDPTMHVWGWEIPVYLFLGGLAAGIMVLGSLLCATRGAAIVFPSAGFDAAGFDAGLRSFDRDAGISVGAKRRRRRRD